MRVRALANLHPKVRTHEGRGSHGPLPVVDGTLVLVEVERLPRGEGRRGPRVLWLWWHGDLQEGRLSPRRWGAKELCDELYVHRKSTRGHNVSLDAPVEINNLRCRVPSLRQHRGPLLDALLNVCC